MKNYLRLPAEYIASLRKSSFHMNAFYLMISTFAVAVFGFLFWIVVTRSYDAAAVGLATTLLSVSGLLSLLGLAGFDTTFVRFLPSSPRKNAYINSGFIVVTIISGVLAVASAIILPIFVPSLGLLHQPWNIVGFAFFTIASTLNVLTNIVFLAYKRAGYIFAISILFSLFKVIVPFIVINGDAMTIFIIAGCAQLVGVVLSIIWMRREFGYVFSPTLDMQAMRLVQKFSLTMYGSSILNLLPPTLLPLIIIHYLGPKEAAYYYMAFTIAGALYTVAYAAMQSAFAEGSHDTATLHSHIKKAAKLVTLLLLPATVVIITISHLLLSVFGADYSQGGAVLLQIFALAALPVAGYSALGALFKVQKHLSGVLGMNLAYAATTLGASIVLIPHFGLIGIGWAWLTGNIVACIVGAIFIITSNKR